MRSQTITLKTKLLEPNRSKANKLDRARLAYTEAVQYFMQRADELGTTSRARLNRETYHEAKEMFAVNSSTLQMAMLKALAAYRSVVAKRKRKQKATLPVFQHPLPFGVRQDRWRLSETRAGAPVLVMAFLPGRSQAAYPIADSEPVRQTMADLEVGCCRQGLAEIWLDKDGNWYAGLTLVYPTGAYEPKDWLGVDLGVVHHAVAATADGQHRLFFDGKSARRRRERWHERRQAMQERGRFGRFTNWRSSSSTKRLWPACRSGG